MYQLANTANLSFVLPHGWEEDSEVNTFSCFLNLLFLTTLLSRIDIGHPTTRIHYPTSNINNKGIGVFSSLDFDPLRT